MKNLIVIDENTADKLREHGIEPEVVYAVSRELVGLLVDISQNEGAPKPKKTRKPSKQRQDTVYRFKVAGAYKGMRPLSNVARLSAALNQPDVDKTLSRVRLLEIMRQTLPDVRDISPYVNHLLAVGIVEPC